MRYVKTKIDADGAAGNSERKNISDHVALNFIGCFNKNTKLQTFLLYYTKHAFAMQLYSCSKV